MKLMVENSKTTAYHFITNWYLDATCLEVYEIISNSSELTRWWPAVYLDLKILSPGESNGKNKEIELYTKGWLPYTLRWKFKVKHTEKPYLIEIEAIGDFDGYGKWTFEQNGNGCKVTYDWRIVVKKPLLRKFSWLLKPAFSANHLWAMRKGLESLQLEIRRKKGEKNVPLPPMPTFPHNFLNNKIL